MVTNYQNGVIAQLLQAIIGQINFDGTPTSNIGDILLSILEQTPYDKEPKSVLAELFLKLKDKLEGRAFTPYDKEPKSAIAEILLSILNETEYDKEPNSRIAELLLELKAELESYAELTASGAIANFTTSVVKPLVNLTAYFKATQEAGTPTPQSPKAISGVSAVKIFQRGANFFNKDTMLINNAYINDVDGTQRTNVGDKCTNYIEVAPNTNYYILSEQTTGRWGGWYDENKVFISGINLYGVRKSPANAKYVRLTVVRLGNGNPDTFSVNFPSSDTEYHAYNPNSQAVTIALGDTYYGGHLTQDKDGKRQFEVTHNIVDLGNLVWTYYTLSPNYWFSNDLKDIIKKTTVNTQIADITCECLQKTSSYNIASGSTTIGIAIHTSGAIRLVYPDMPITAEDLIADISGNKFAYPIAEPYTIDLPDGEPIITLNGTNNIYADTGDTSVTYLAKIADNLNATAKLRAEVKAQKEKAKEELKEDVKEDVKELEPIKDSGEKKRGA